MFWVFDEASRDVTYCCVDFIRGGHRTKELAHPVDARGGSQGGCYRRKDGDGEVQDFL